MKKVAPMLLVGITLLFAGFILGLLTGRSFTGDAVTVQAVSSVEINASAPSVPAGSELLPLININTATADQLDALPGIGPVIAQRIVDYREANGDFQSISELTRISGIGNEKLLTIHNLITVGG